MTNLFKRFVIDSEGNELNAHELATIAGKCKSWAYRYLNDPNIVSLSDFVNVVLTPKKSTCGIYLPDKNGNEYTLTQISEIVGRSTSWVCKYNKSGECCTLEDFKNKDKDTSRDEVLKGASLHPEEIPIGTWERENLPKSISNKKTPRSVRRDINKEEKGRPYKRSLSDAHVKEALAQMSLNPILKEDFDLQAQSELSR